MIHDALKTKQKSINKIIRIKISYILRLTVNSAEHCVDPARFSMIIVSSPGSSCKQSSVVNVNFPFECNYDVYFFKFDSISNGKPLCNQRMVGFG